MRDRKKIQPILLVLAMFLPSQILFAQDFTYYLSSDTIHYMSGGRIIITQEWSHPSDREIDPPFMPDRIAKLEKVNEGEISKDRVKDKVIMHRNIVYTCFDTGYYQIDPLGWRVKGDSVFSNPLFLNVYYAEVDTSEDIMDIEEPLNVPYGFFEMLPSIIFVLILGMFLAGVYVMYCLIKTEIKKTDAPYRPPYFVAFEQLEDLKEQKLWQKGEVKQYHFKLSLIVREYIQRLYGKPTADLTTLQLQELCLDLNISENLVNEVVKYLMIGDLAKFAKANPLPNENEEAWDVIHLFVSSTMRKPEDSKEQDE